MNIGTVRDWLRNFAEDPDNKTQMSANVYEKLWHMIQIIDHELEENKKEGK